MKIEDVLGRWTIQEWRQDYDDGRIVHPFGEEIIGFIQYNPDLTLFLLLTSAKREPFRTGGQWSAQDFEKASAYSSCLSYAGRFEIKEDEIHHHVDISLFPNWKNGVQRRKATVQRGRLDLVARLEDGTTEARTATLSWRRAPQGVVV